jgi:putative ABC transport system permease protein
MNLNLRPIFSTLLRNRTGAVLVAMQIAVALAVLVNATYIVKQRLDEINRPTGVDDKNLFSMDATGFTPRYDYASSVREDLAYLRGLDGVVAATVTDDVPFNPNGDSEALFKTPDIKLSNLVGAYCYEMDEQGLQTLGSHIIAGRGFRKEEILPPMTPATSTRPFPQIVVTQRLAKTLFPDSNAVGKQVYDFQARPVTIVGIASDMAGPWPAAEGTFIHGAYWVPEQPLMYGFHYLVRTAPGRRDEIMRVAAAHLAQSSRDRAISSVRSVEYYKEFTYLTARVTVDTLMIVTALLLGVAALGIFGLATFNVTTRTKQIGTRRALGARKADVVSYFMVENALITTAGIVLGCALALGIGYWLSLQYQLPRLDLYYLVGGFLALWAIGQLAAWQPARRAAKVPPSVATRTA